MTFNHFDCTDSHIDGVKKAVGLILHVGPNEMSVLSQCRHCDLVEVVDRPMVTINVMHSIFGEGVLMVFISAFEHSLQSGVNLKTTQYEVSRLNTAKPFVRVVE